MNVILTKGIQGKPGLSKGSYVYILGIHHGGAEYGNNVFVTLNAGGRAQGFHIKHQNRAKDPVVRLHHNFGAGYIEFKSSQKFVDLVSAAA